MVGSGGVIMKAQFHFFMGLKLERKGKSENKSERTRDRNRNREIATGVMGQHSLVY